MKGRDRRRAKRIPAASAQDDHVPRAGASVAGERRPRRGPLEVNPDDTLTVQFSRVDIDSEWCLTKISKADHRRLLDRLRSIETMTVYQVFSSDGTVGKDYDIDRIPNTRAVRRLSDLELDDRDKISRLDIGPTQRLYGFREGGRFYVIWWDPEHEIWPSKLKHT